MQLIFSILIGLLLINIPSMANTDPYELAKCLKSKGAIMYGSPKCGHCKHLISEFNGAFEKERIPFKNCKGRDKKECRRARVGAFPKWTFSNGAEVSRPHDLEELARVSGCNMSGGGVMTHQDNHSHESHAISGDEASTAQIAKCLTNKGVVMYGSPVCGHCKHEKAWFGSDVKYITEYNCKANRRKCDKLRTYPFPTWLQESTGNRITRPESLQELAHNFGCDRVEETTPVQTQVQEEQTQNDYFESNSGSPYTSGVLTDDQKMNITRCLNSNNLTLYLNKQFTMSTKQEQDLGSAINMLENVVDCGSFYKDEKCKGFTIFPVWQRSDGAYVDGYVELKTLGKHFNCQF